METECSTSDPAGTCPGPATALACPSLAAFASPRELEAHLGACNPCAAAVVRCARGGCAAAWVPLDGIVNYWAERTAWSFRSPNSRTWQPLLGLDVEDAARDKGFDLLLSSPACDPSQVLERGFRPLLIRVMHNGAIDVYRKSTKAALPMDPADLEPDDGENERPHDVIVARLPGPETAAAAVDLGRLTDDVDAVLLEPAAAAVRQDWAQHQNRDPRGGEPLFWAWIGIKYESASAGASWSQPELALRVGVSQPTVSRSIRRFKAALAKRMQDLEDEPADRARRDVSLALDNGLRKFLLDES